jgi:alpha-tubulin suppressor-like RCC1 family protein
MGRAVGVAALVLTASCFVGGLEVDEGLDRRGGATAVDASASAGAAAGVDASAGAGGKAGSGGVGGSPAGHGGAPGKAGAGGNSGTGGSAGVGGWAGTGGAAGAAGTGGNPGAGGTAGPDASAGAGGSGGSGGGGGWAGTAGSSGTGTGGTGGGSGTAGSSGGGGAAGAGGQAGTGGTGGSGGGLAGTGGSAGGAAGASGGGGAGGAAGIGGHGGGAGAAGAVADASTDADSAAGAGGAAGNAGSGGSAGGDSGADTGSPCIAEIVVGGTFACARKTDGTLWCWGANAYGQLADGSWVGPGCNSVCRPLPQKVSVLGTAVAEVALGDGHGCARKVDGTLWCWGANHVGQLGDGTTSGQNCQGPCQPLPIQVASLGASVARVRAAVNSTCATKTEHTLWCWGPNDSAQVGDGTSGGIRPSPVPVTALGSAASSVSVGGRHACAVKADGSLWCWGANDKGQLGDGTTSQPPCWCKPVPVAVSALGSNVAEVAVGGSHTCARRTDGTLWCWGANYVGQLGDGTTSPRSSPSFVASLGSAVVQVVAAYEHTCARKGDGSLWCWGLNEAGQLGDGTMAGQSCFNGKPCRPSPGHVVALGSSVEGASAAYHNTCAMKSDSSVWCWGWNGMGQLGDGTTSGQPCLGGAVCKASPVKVGLSCP